MKGRREIKRNHWRIPWEHHGRTPPPNHPTPRGRNSFIFMQFSAKNIPLWGLAPPLRKILDPPLVTTLHIFFLTGVSIIISDTGNIIRNDNTSDVPLAEVEAVVVLYSLCKRRTYKMFVNLFCKKPKLYIHFWA